MNRIMIAVSIICIAVCVIYLFNQPLDQTLSPEFHEPTMINQK